MERPWESHFSLAVLLASVAIATGELWNVFAGSAIGAVAFFVALRPLFRKDFEPVARAGPRQQAGSVGYSSRNPPR